MFEHLIIMYLIGYKSCRNSYCTKFQGKNLEDLVQARAHELLQVTYFYVVFTFSEEINSLAINNLK